MVIAQTLRLQTSECADFKTSECADFKIVECADFKTSECADFLTFFNQINRLGLNNNKLTGLPPELLNLTGLRYLNLKSNNFKEFPSIV